MIWTVLFFFFQAEDGIRDKLVTGVQTCALPISLVANLPSFADDIFCQHASQAFAPEFGPKIEALHLADFAVQLVQSHASCQLAFIQSEPQAAIGWLVVARKPGQFLVEILEA